MGSPYRDEFHTLLNFQKVLMKIYRDAGLNDLSGTKKNDIGKIFRHSHDFILQVWEAFYRYQINVFLKWRENPERKNICELNTESLSKEITSCLENFPENPLEDQDRLAKFLSTEIELKEAINGLWDDFMQFRTDLSSINETFKFWEIYT